ncbi:hypothetical protein [Acinetobacter haemolyticus]|uniref:hypothetical protein n=1 Tax=Acinetobacter haemolyticus TaxID=29430 RepID=UPI00135B12DB|nr:hypothetical protein [Acinetobacter haemolyticus]
MTEFPFNSRMDDTKINWLLRTKLGTLDVLQNSYTFDVQPSVINILGMMMCA